jgi:hypothetical protein
MDPRTLSSVGLICRWITGQAISGPIEHGLPGARQNRHPRCVTNRRIAVSACRGADERSRCGERAAPVGQLLMEQRPYMDHVWPNFQRNANIRRASPRGDLDRIVEEGLGTADLDQQRRQTLEIRIKWGGKRCPWRFPPEIPVGQVQKQTLAPGECFGLAMAAVLPWTMPLM